MTGRPRTKRLRKGLRVHIEFTLVPPEWWESLRSLRDEETKGEAPARLNRHPLGVAVVALTLALVAGACSNGGSVTVDKSNGGNGGSSNAELTGAGATFPGPLSARWAEEYNKKTGVVHRSEVQAPRTRLRRT